MTSMGSSFSSTRGTTTTTTTKKKAVAARPRQSKANSSKKRRGKTASVTAETNPVASTSSNTISINMEPCKKASHSTTLRNRRSSKDSSTINDSSMELLDANHGINDTSKMTKGRTNQDSFKKHPSKVNQVREQPTMKHPSNALSSRAESLSAGESSKGIGHGIKAHVTELPCNEHIASSTIKEINSSQARPNLVSSWKHSAGDAHSFNSSSSLEGEFLDHDDTWIPDSVEIKTFSPPESVTSMPSSNTSLTMDSLQHTKKYRHASSDCDVWDATIPGDDSLGMTESANGGSGMDADSYSYASTEEYFSTDDGTNRKTGLSSFKETDGTFERRREQRDDQEFECSRPKLFEEPRQGANQQVRPFNHQPFPYERYPVTLQQSGVRPYLGVPYPPMMKQHPMGQQPMFPGMFRPVPQRLAAAQHNLSMSGYDCYHGPPTPRMERHGHYQSQQQEFRTKDVLDSASYGRGGYYNPYSAGEMARRAPLPPPRHGVGMESVYHPREMGRGLREPMADPARRYEIGPTGFSRESTDFSRAGYGSHGSDAVGRRDPVAAIGMQAIKQAAPQSRPTDAHQSCPQGVFLSRGVKVTMLDEQKKIFVIDLLSSQTCNLIRRLLNDHLHQAEKSGDTSKLWRTLYTYTKMDLPCTEVTSITEIVQLLISNINKIVGDVYDKRKEAAKLRPRSWKEPHILLYQCVPGKPTHTGVEMHYDGSHITWQLMLSALHEYQGGGTYIRCLRRTVKLRQGQVLVHPGELYHKGVDITGGTRLLMVGFMDGFDPEIKDGSKQSAKSVNECEKHVVIV